MGQGTRQRFPALAVFLLVGGVVLAGCAAPAEQVKSTDHETWVDCYFSDRTYAHLTIADCKAQNGSVRAPQSGPMVTYPMNVKWGGRTDLVRGELTAPRNGLHGPVLILLEVTGDRCEGSFRYTRSPRGEWSINCDSGVTASGTFTYYSRNNLISGVGYDSKGNWVGFDAWPPKQ